MEGSLPPFPPPYTRANMERVWCVVALMRGLCRVGSEEARLGEEDSERKTRRVLCCDAERRRWWQAG